MPRSFSSLAMPPSDVMPSARSDSMTGSRLAAWLVSSGSSAWQASSVLERTELLGRHGVSCRTATVLICNSGN